MSLEENQKRVLNEFRLLGNTSKAEIVQRINLTHPAVTQIVKKLCNMGYLKEEGEKRRGARGQPATIYSISETNLFVGIHVGRRRLEFIALDINGNTISRERVNVGFTDKQALTLTSKNALNAFLQQNSLAKQNIIGFGISTPYFWQSWKALLPTQHSEDNGWTSSIVTTLFDFPQHCPVIVENDGSAAALGELTFGNGRSFTDFLYVNIGTFIGGGLVLKGTLSTGAHGNTGAIGSFPVSPSTLAQTQDTQGLDILLRRASLYTLIEHAKRHGHTLTLSEINDLTTHNAPKYLHEWIEDCAGALAQAFVGAWALIDIEAIVLDGALSQSILSKIIEQVRLKINLINIEGIIPCDIVLGHLGSMAQSMGAACLPMLQTLGPPPTGDFTCERERSH